MSEPTEQAAPVDPYIAAAEFGIEQGKLDVVFHGELSVEHQFLMIKVGRWAAWRAARNAATAMLAKATEMGLTPEQIEGLTQVAEEWAYD